ncbi:hypothetical protein [Aureibacter tunicatorum]|uniref:Uncharacterized protein n=1 Tax=Aureibacter tunicatorum TaxID=866807 RepID=A0AAE3XSL7_9BACT|nr:hypothetical protein [Aureibacter tunicatorum]MDR6240814.1 hypothetical protein [Aureibacter tunicatorum]BDD06853.1 hypothetical protein AUTU_43360 [Aureibacter tunicatorum]
MRRKKVNWQVCTKIERNMTIEFIKDAIDKSSGYIFNHSMFSDLDLSICIEIEERDVHDLLLEFSKLLEVNTKNMDQINSNSSKDMFVYLQISFLKGKGDLINKIPDVPG